MVMENSSLKTRVFPWTKPNKKNKCSDYSQSKHVNRTFRVLFRFPHDLENRSRSHTLVCTDKTQLRLSSCKFKTSHLNRVPETLINITYFGQAQKTHEAFPVNILSQQ